MGTFPRVTHPSATPYCYGVRLACFRPAASVRSEPGSNSQVGLELLIWRSHVLRATTLARRHIHIDEVQHVSPRVIAHERRHGVVPRNVYRRSLVRPHLLPSKASLLRSRKRPARTPPSTFLFLQIHLSNSPEIVAIPLPGEPESRRNSRSPTEIGDLSHRW